MFVVRSAQIEDLPDLLALVRSYPKGMTTLPDDETYLKNRIHDSLRAFDPLIRRPGGEFYLFILEDLQMKKVIGTSGILSKVGGFEPFYTYKIEEEVHSSEELKVETWINLLHFTAAHNGPAEIGSLYLDPAYRKKGLARLLSLSRFLFMAEFPERFDQTVISELRGFIDQHGQSPFWENVGRRFFDTNFETADAMSITGKKDFIVKLMPKHPIYIPLLPQEAQDVIGKVHLESEPAFSLLKQEGFCFNNEVDIFDAGPTVKTPMNKIRTIDESRRKQVRDFNGSKKNQDFILSNSQINFRACLGSVGENSDGTVTLSKEAADAIRAEAGGPVRLVPLRSAKTHP